jgi:hypothetical protein
MVKLGRRYAALEYKTGNFLQIERRDTAIGIH